MITRPTHDALTVRSKFATVQRPMHQLWFTRGHHIKETPGYIFIADNLSAICSHRWARTCVNACRHAFGLLVGEPFEDEHVAFSKNRLVVNDSYRDRLLAPEIADLVDLSDALELSVQQRKAFFRCFLHLDFMRRAGVSRSELLRYCDLRETPAAHHLLRVDGAFAVEASPHRRDQFRAQRWDVIQLLSLTFSLCTMEVETVIALCVEQIMNRAVVSEIPLDEHDKLVRCIRECLLLSFGVPNPVEEKLGQFLSKTYGPSKVNFVEIHKVRGVRDVARYFPVLLYPCLWLQRVIKRRVLGEATWRRLKVRRSELQLRGLGVLFVSATEIVAAARVCVHNKEPTNSHPPSETEHERASSTSRMKVAPDEENDCQKKGLGVGEPTISGVDEINNEDDAWRITADSALATAFVLESCHDNKLENGITQDPAVLFTEILREVQESTLGPHSVTMIQRYLIREHGYQLATFLFSKSSMKGLSGNLVASKSVSKDELRAVLRHSKANTGAPLVEDKSIYWKEYVDPLLKRVFYHNIRTGESRWEAPSTLLSKRRRKVAKHQ